MNNTPLKQEKNQGAACIAPPKVGIDVQSANGAAHCAFSGSLTVRTLPEAAKILRTLGGKTRGPVTLDLSGLSEMDTSGALLLNRTVESLAQGGVSCEITNVEERWKQILAKSVLPPSDKDAQGTKPGMLHSLVAGIGETVVESVNTSLRLIGFFGLFLVTLGRLLLRPSRMRWTSLTFQMEQVGLKAVPIVGLLTFLIGLVVAYMGAQQLSMFGADIFAVNLLEVTVMREMAVLITSIVVAGRSSSSFTAQIGSMVANEEVAALRSMGLDPLVLLVMPRVLALVLCLPMLVFIADIMALAGGSVALQMTISMSPHAFISQLGEVASTKNFVVGMIKTPFFAMAIGLVGCFQGFRATGSAESVGFLTTVSVVQSIFIVILLDAVFAIFFTTLGI